MEIPVGAVALKTTTVLVQRLVADNLDMVSGRRVIAAEEDYRRGDRFAPSLPTSIVARVFAHPSQDMFLV